MRDINKFSNNVMARQLFLTLGAPDPGQSASAERSVHAVTAWLSRASLPMPELVLKNGCGLSRLERISADSLARLLRQAYAGPRMPEFVASLPVVWNRTACPQGTASASTSASRMAGSFRAKKVEPAAT